MFPSGQQSGEKGLQLNKRIRGSAMLMIMFFSCTLQLCMRWMFVFAIAGRGLFELHFARRASGGTSHCPLPLTWLFSSVPPHSVHPPLLFLSSLLCGSLPGKVNHSVTFCLDLILAQKCRVWGPQLLLSLHFSFFFFLMCQNENQAFPPFPLLNALQNHSYSIT